MSGIVTPAKLQLLNVIKQNRTSALQEYAVMNYGIAEGTFERTFDHRFETASIYPAFTPNWNTTVYLEWITSTQFKVRFGTTAGRAAALTYRISRTGGSLSLAASATSATLTHNLNDATARYFFTPDWNTTVYTTAKAANSITLSIGTQSSSAQTIRYVKFDDSDGQSVTPTAAASTSLITHSQANPFTHAFFTPSWNTTVWPDDRTRRDNDLRVLYQVEPQSGQNLDVVTAEPTIA